MRSRRRSRRSSPRRMLKPITHIPSVIGNNPAANIAIVHFSLVCGTVAGESLSGDVINENRLVDVPPGRRTGTHTVQFSILNPVTNAIYEYAWLKIDKADTVPLLGTLLPTSAECNSQGTQQAIRQEQPGRVINYGTIGVTPGQTTTRTIKAYWGKYGKSKVSIGDHYVFYVFQRGGSASNSYNVEFRYKTTD